MTAEQNSGMRKAVRQFALALVACTAVAGGAALATDGDGAAPQEQHAGVTNEWPYATPTPVAPTN